MKKIINLFSLKYIFLIFLGTMLVNIWYTKTHDVIIQNGIIQNPSSVTLILGFIQVFVIGILLYKLVVKFMEYVDKVGGKKEIEINTRIMNTPIELETKKIEPLRRYEKDMMVSIVASTIFVVALLYPSWIGFDVMENGPETMYGYDIFIIGWAGIFTLYVPWYFLFPASTIVRKISTGVEGKMLKSRILLFLFWLEGFIAVVGFRWGGASDAGDFQITSIGPSFWMWTILVWYILISSYIYVNFSEEKIRSYTKLASVIAITSTILIIAEYHITNLIQLY